MILVSFIITSILLSLFFIINVKQNLNFRIEFFSIILVLHMVLIAFQQFTHIHPWSQYVFSFCLYLFFIWKMRDNITSSSGLKFMKKINGYTLAILSLCVGTHFLASLMPGGWSLPFYLLGALALCFVLTWPFYLWFTFLIAQRPPQVPSNRFIILGAGIFTEQVTPMLKSRLDTALSLANQSKSSPIFMVSGGQGPDEPISEALAMQRYLLAQGVPKKQILMEDQSTNTVENMAYSKPFFPHQKGVCVTSEFHILRALKIGQQQGLSLVGYGASSPIVFRARSLIRDYCGLLFKYALLWWSFGSLVVLIRLLYILS